MMLCAQPFANTALKGMGDGAEVAMNEIQPKLLQ